MGRLLTGAALAVLLAGLAGCARLTAPRIPPDLTAGEAYAAVVAQTARIEDLTASGTVRARKAVGDEQTAGMSLRYIAPDRFRVAIKGFLGITGAFILTTPDSVYMYDPSEDVYIIAGRNSTVLRRLAPDLALDLDRLPTVLTGIRPPESPTGLRLDRTDGDGILTVEAGDTRYRYTLSGPSLLIMREEVLEMDTVVWDRTVEKYDRVDGIPVPREVTANGLGGRLSLTLSKVTVNSGLTGADLALPESPTAERIEY